jgi:threonine/homoserine/homoserine lactone efflux protein
VSDSSALSFCWIVLNGWQYQSKPTQSTPGGMVSEDVISGPASIIMIFLPGKVRLISSAEAPISAGVAPRHYGGQVGQAAQHRLESRTLGVRPKRGWTRSLQLDGMFAALLGFALASTFLILAPGPDSLLVMRNTLRSGHRAGLVTAAGTLTGLMIWAIAAALGLSALLQASRVGYEIVRFTGAAYLIWLGISTLGPFRIRHHPPADHESTKPARPATGLRRAYLNGLASNLVNPKIGVFFIAFLPGFIPAGQPTGALSFALGLFFVIETGLWLATVVWMVNHGIGWLRRSGIQRWLERAAGVVLIGFGVRLAVESR